MNPARFDDETNCEKWGVLDGDYVYFFTQAFDELCEAGGFSRKSIMSWLEKKKLSLQGSGSCYQGETHQWEADQVHLHTDRAGRGAGR